MLLAFTCARAIGNLWSICLGVNILSPLPFVAFIGNIPLLKGLRVNSQPSYSKVFFSLSCFFSCF